MLMAAAYVAAVLRRLNCFTCYGGRTWKLYPCTGCGGGSGVSAIDGTLHKPCTCVRVLWFQRHH